MSDLSCCFLHAADLRLDEPLLGVGEAPESLRPALLDAPYVAAERVFDTAIQEHVALVVLSGSVLDLTSPHPRAIAFLAEQFRRLAAESIPVCWAGGARDRGSDWPAAIKLPDSVHHFDGTMVERVALAGRCAMPLAILGRSGGGADDIPIADFVADAHGAFSIAASCGRLDPGRVGTLGIEYWALGGRRDRKTLCSEPRTVHYPGSPQGRGPQDVGPHGCTLVEVQAHRQMRLRFVPCDLVRWQHERVLVARSAVWDDVTTKLSERLHDLRSQTPDGPLLVRWTLVATDGGEASPGLSELAQRVEKWLRQQSSGHGDLCWPVSVDIEWADRVSAASYKEDTLLGDYLRAIRTMQEDPVAIREALSELAEAVSGARWVAELSDPDVRRAVMQDAAELGAALLRGEVLT